MLRTKLFKLVESDELTKAEFDALTYHLSPQQQRLFLYLESNGLTVTMVLNRECSIANVSDVASSLNKRLIVCGDERQVVCLMKPHVNQFGQKGIIGHWQLIGSAANE